MKRFNLEHFNENPLTQPREQIVPESAQGVEESSLSSKTSQTPSYLVIIVVYFIVKSQCSHYKCIFIHQNYRI